MRRLRGSWDPLRLIAGALESWYHLHLVEDGVEQVAKAHRRRGGLEGGVHRKQLGFEQ